MYQEETTQAYEEMVYISESEKANIDTAIEEVEDAAAEVLQGESIHDGDIIDHIAVNDVPTKIDKDVEDHVYDDENNDIDAIRDNRDPDDVAYAQAYPYEDDEEDQGLDAEDLVAASTNENIVDENTANIIIGALFGGSEEDE